MWVNIFEAEDYSEEAQVKVVTSLTGQDLLKVVKQGEVLATEWLHSQGYDVEFRNIVQGRTTGRGKDNQIIDLRAPVNGRKHDKCPTCGKRDDNLIIIP